MSDLTKLFERLDQSEERFIKMINQIPDDKFNATPEAGGWSPAQHAEHVLTLEHLVNGVLEGDSQEIERDPQEKAEKIGYTFLNFEEKLTAPEVVHPKGELTEKGNLAVQFKAVRGQLKSMLENAAIDKEYTGFEHALFGYLTPIEWAYFDLYHSERHRKLMEAAAYPEKAADLVPPKGRQRKTRPPRPPREPRTPRASRSSRRNR